MMRELTSGRGVGGVVRRIRALREEAEDVEEGAHKAHTVAR